MRYFQDIFRLFFPKLCVNCSVVLIEQENSLCLNCLSELPLTNFVCADDNPVEKTFYGRIPVEFAASILYYHPKGLSQKLIYALKYQGQQDIGRLLATQFLMKYASTERLPAFDYIIPVPLHPKKLKSRGYNQLTTFGETLAEGLNAQYQSKILTRISSSETQTKKKRMDRFKQIDGVFIANATALKKGQHILLIDDVITTGATLEACALSLLKSQVKISLLTMAYTE